MTLMASDYLSKDILLTGGFVVDGETKSVYRADLLIRDGQIARIGQDILVNNEQEVQDHQLHRPNHHRRICRYPCPYRIEHGATTSVW